MVVTSSKSHSEGMLEFAHLDMNLGSNSRA